MYTAFHVLATDILKTSWTNVGGGGHKHPVDGRIYKIYASLNKLIYTINIDSNNDENGANPQLQL